MRKDLVDSYASSRSLQLVTTIRGERTPHIDYFERCLPEDFQAIYQSRVNDFVSVIGLE